MIKNEAIIKIEKELNDGISARHCMYNTTLSFKAKGVHTLLLDIVRTKGSSNITLKELVKYSSDGITSIRSAIHELELAGYIEKGHLKSQKGQFCGYRYIVHEVSIHDKYYKNYERQTLNITDSIKSENGHKLDNLDAEIMKSNTDIITKVTKPNYSEKSEFSDTPKIRKHDSVKTIDKTETQPPRDSITAIPPNISLLIYTRTHARTHADFDLELQRTTNSNKVSQSVCHHTEETNIQKGRFSEKVRFVKHKIKKALTSNKPQKDKKPANSAKSKANKFKPFESVEKVNKVLKSVNKPDNKSLEAELAMKEIQANIGIQELEKVFPADVDLLREINSNIYDMYVSDIVKVEKVEKPNFVIRKMLMRLTQSHIQQLVSKIKAYNKKIINKRGFLQTAIYNIALEFNVDIQTSANAMMATV